MFSPEDLKLWVATGSALATNNPYIGFDFNEEIKGNQSKITSKILQGYQFKDPNKWMGQQKYIEAYYIFESNPKQVEGIFYGIDPMIHLHVAEDTGTDAIMAFNLTSYDKRLKIKIDLSKNGLKFHIIEIFYGINQKIEALSKYYELEKLLKFEMEIPSLSSVIALLK